MNQEFWNESYQDDPEHTIVPDRILMDEVQGLEPGRALDLGCGTGTNALALAERGWSVLGIDWADHAIKLANEQAAARGLDAEFVAADITTWQPTQSFDLVVSTYSLPTGEEGARILQTAVRALAEGGTLIIAEWNRSMAAVWAFAADELWTPNEISVHLVELEIENAEVRHIQGFFTDDDARGTDSADADVLFVRARKMEGK